MCWALGIITKGATSTCRSPVLIYVGHWENSSNIGHHFKAHTAFYSMCPILTWCFLTDVSYVYSIACSTIFKGQWHLNDGAKRKNTESHGKTPSPYFCSYKMGSLVRSEGIWDTMVINNTLSRWQWRQAFHTQSVYSIRQITVPVTVEGSDVISVPWVSVWSPVQWHGIWHPVCHHLTRWEHSKVDGSALWRKASAVGHIRYLHPQHYCRLAPGPLEKLKVTWKRAKWPS